MRRSLRQDKAPIRTIGCEDESEHVKDEMDRILRGNAGDSRLCRSGLLRDSFHRFSGRHLEAEALHSLYTSYEGFSVPGDEYISRDRDHRTSEFDEFMGQSHCSARRSQSHSSGPSGRT